MINASPYVVVNNCKETLDYYQNMLGGEIRILAGNAGKVMHAELHVGNNLIHFADSMGQPTTKGDNIRIICQFDNECEIRKVYTALTTEGQVVLELQDTFFGALHGVVTDKNNITWALNMFRR